MCLIGVDDPKNQKNFFKKSSLKKRRKGKEKQKNHFLFTEEKCNINLKA